MISYKEAVELIGLEFESIVMETEEISLNDAPQRTLAENIYADINLPPFNNSAVDGIAIKYSDNITNWNLIGEISAGNFKEYEFDKFSAVTIMTGARIPDFCDSVIPIEDIAFDGNSVKLNENVRIKNGMNIRRFSSDITAGGLAIPINTFLQSRHIAAAASCGKSKLKVFKQLNISALATGDELIPVSEIPQNDKIRISNTYALCAGIRELNQIPLNLGFTGDNRRELKTELSKILESEADICITTGGVSVGKFDSVKDLFKELGVKEIFWRVNIKPGKPVFFGNYESGGKKKLIFGLPGNPVSSLVNFELFIKPFISKKFAMEQPGVINALLDNDLNKRDNKRHFVKALFYKDTDGAYRVTSQISQSSGNLIEFSKANCLIEIKEERMNPRKGETVACIKI